MSKFALTSPGASFDLRDAPALLAPVAAVYEAMLDRDGATEAGVGWLGGTQAKRFEILAGLMPTDEPNLDIADLGSGYGAFFEYLLAHPRLRFASYVGYDISEAMVAAAADRIRDPRVTFVQSLIVTKPADLCFASGTYNVALDADGASWTGYVLESLKNLARMSRIGFAFNLLSPASDRDPAIFARPPGIFVDFCRDTLGGRVRLIEDYGLPEWTLHVTRPDL